MQVTPTTTSGAADLPEALIERLEDAVYEWGNYVDEDHAPRPLTRHVDPHIKAIAAELQRLRAALASAPAQPDPLQEQAGMYEDDFAPQADSVQEDAARYRFLRDGEWRGTDLEPFIRLQLNTLWDAKIDDARAAQEGASDALPL